MGIKKYILNSYQLRIKFICLNFDVTYLFVAFNLFLFFFLYHLFLCFHIHFQLLCHILLDLLSFYALHLCWPSRSPTNAIVSFAAFVFDNLFIHDIYSSFDVVIILLTHFYVALMMTFCLSQGFIKSKLHMFLHRLVTFRSISFKRIYFLLENFYSLFIFSATRTGYNSILAFFFAIFH